MKYCEIINSCLQVLTEHCLGSFYTHLPMCKENISLYSRKKKTSGFEITAALLLNWTLDGLSC